MFSVFYIPDHLIFPKQNLPVKRLTEYTESLISNFFEKKHDSQTQIKGTHGVVGKEFLLFIVSFISCPINVECFLHKSGGVKAFLIPECFFYPSSTVLKNLIEFNYKHGFGSDKMRGKTIPPFLLMSKKSSLAEI